MMVEEEAGVDHSTIRQQSGDGFPAQFHAPVGAQRSCSASPGYHYSKGADNMYSETIEQYMVELSLGVERLSGEIATHQAQITLLELEHGRASALVQMLERWFTFGPAEELDWVRFKLRLSKRELAQCKAQLDILATTVSPLELTPEFVKLLSSRSNQEVLVRS
jgi:hypothetical protein